MNITSALEALVNREDLTRNQSEALFTQAMKGELTDAQLAGLLIAMRVKNETADELAGAAAAMRALSLKVEINQNSLVDTCGTGGSGGAKLFNISTAAAFVAAAGGAYVAKHGNRAMTSKSGSADVLEAAGVSLALTPEQVAQCVEQTGVGFMFAQAHHSAMRHAAGVRRELGVRTMMNVLGPMTNPAGAKQQVIGVFAPQWQKRMAQVLQQLGSKHALIVHSEGLDEFSLSAATEVVELKDGKISQYRITPEDVGLSSRSMAGLTSASPDDSLQHIRTALSDADSAAAQIVALNAGAALYVAQRSDSLQAGVSLALSCIDQGAAKQRLNALAELSQTLQKDTNHE